ncbi:hypothetical protein WJX79_005362 [Trebouxia sp. C0005]
MLYEQPTDTQHVQCIIDELQLAAHQCLTQGYERPADPVNHMQAKNAMQTKGANTTAVFDVIMQELGMLKTLTTQALLKQRADSGALQPLQKAVSLWKKRPGVKALFDFGVLDAKSHCSLHTANIRHDADQWNPSLLHPAVAAASQSRWTLDNFAYGSTSFHGWLSIFQHPMVKPHVLTALSNGKDFQVWGSSIGWLVFYAALTYGLRAVGYELLSCHVDTAQQLASYFQVPGVSFHAKDMLKSDLGCKR